MVILMKREFRERECIHQDDGVDGAFYNGVFYLQALQRLPVDEAVKMSGKVSSFFWADAPTQRYSAGDDAEFEEASLRKILAQSAGTPV